MKIFVPKIYSDCFNNRNPVCKLKSGETLRTCTLDCFGHDARDKKVSQHINPLTGPFYIEGAEPGDTLAVKILKLTPLRKTGVSFDALVQDVALKKAQKPQKIYWKIDKVRKTVSRNKLEFKMKPMLGCFGVAPEKKPVKSVTSSNCGGNIDYNGFGEGVTAFFPVFQKGALFYVADGHTLQGEGEVIGTGVECAFEVTLKFTVLKRLKVNWPRGENKDEIFTVGSGRPLDAALKIATSEMINWLLQSFKYGKKPAEILLGLKAKYRIGNICDPAYTVICKVKKRDLK